MAHLLTTIEDISPAWLTDALQHAGSHAFTIQRVQVTHIHTEQPHSIGYRLKAQWSPEAPTTLPTRFFLKLPRQPDPDGFASAGAREIATYQFLATHQTQLPTIPCYDAVYDVHQRRYHLLLADVSHSHHQPHWHLSIAEAYVQQTVDCLARVHAYWWNQPARALPIATVRSAEQVASAVQHVQDVLPHFVADGAVLLTPQDRLLYTRLVSAAPRLLARWLQPSHPTLVHGDAHFWNFLYPHTPRTQPTYILDWQQQHLDWGVSDLAHMLVLRYPHRTPANEYGFVQQYYRTLVQQGVANYTWENCWRDYRRAVVEQLFVPLEWYTAGQPDALWHLFVPRALTAYRDLNCEEFLDV